MAEEPGGEPRREGGCGIGARLRGARERAELSLAQAAQRLHVSLDVLAALEAEHFEAIGAPIYVKSYLSRYAELLGEPVQPLLDELAAAAAIPAPDLTRIPRAEGKGARVPTGAVLSIAVVALGVLAVGALSWWGWSRWRMGRLVPASAPSTLSPQPTRRAAPAAAQQTMPSAAGSDAARSAPAARAASAAVTVGQPGSVRITLQFPAASWVSVSDAAGKPLYRGLAGAGTTETMSGSAPLHVVLGYADGVKLRVNGREVPISSYRGRDHAVSIAVSAAGQVSSAPRHSGG